MAFEIVHRDPWLLARFPEPQAVLSWSVNRPGHVVADTVAWLQVHDRDLAPSVDPLEFLAHRLAREGLPDAVGLITSRLIRHHHMARREVEGVEARCLITLDLGNGAHVADADGSAGAGTINLLCWISAPLAHPAMLEALSIAAEARTAAVLEAAIVLPGRRRPVTGTGTDCIVIACPPAGETARSYAGLHTPVGQAVAASVYEAGRAAVETWRAGFDATA